MISIEPAYLEKSDAAAYLALSESTFEKLVREAGMPPPRLLSGRRVAWLVRELREWTEARPVSSLLPPPNTGARKSKPTRAATALAMLPPGLPA